MRRGRPAQRSTVQGSGEPRARAGQPNPDSKAISSPLRPRLREPLCDRLEPEAERVASALAAEELLIA